MNSYRIIWSKDPKGTKNVLILGTSVMALYAIDVIIENGHTLHEVKPGRVDDQTGEFHRHGELV